MATSHDAEGDHLRARTSAAERLWFNNEMHLTSGRSHGRPPACR
jgi:hypothetical protein